MSNVINGPGFRPRALWPGVQMRPFEWHPIDPLPALLPIRCGYCGLRAATNIGHCDGCGAPK